MKVRKRSVDRILMLVMCVSILVTGGCASHGYKHADTASNSIEGMLAEIISGQKQIEATVNAMNKVISTAATNPRPAYKTFTREFEKTEKQAKKVSKRAAQIKSQGRAYFKAWESEFEKVASPELKKQFQLRKDRLEGEYTRIQAFSEGLRDDFQTFMSNLRDIDTVLGVDLTRGGIASVAGYAKKATAKAWSINKRLERYIEVLDEVAAQMRPGK